MQRIRESALSVLLLLAFVYVLYARGGPYFDRPATVVEHVYPKKHDTRDALLLLEDIRPLLPRGAQVACFSPDAEGKFRNDTASFHAAVAALPYQMVLPPFSAAEGIPKNTLAEYVVAVDNPFTHPDYRLEAEYPTGRLYKVVR
jgi:hypothetical protein